VSPTNPKGPANSSKEGVRELLDLPFDQYQRYRDVKEIVERLRTAAGPFWLLDVGGGEGQYLPAPAFFTEDRVWVADLHDISSPRYVRASGLHLPFREKAFDIVFSCDTLEHVPRKQRAQFVKELFRASRRFVILVAPFRSALNEAAEQLIQEIYTQESREPNRALLEHAAYGLPDREKTQALIQKLSAYFLTFSSGNIHNWLIMNSIIFALGPISADLYRAANRIYNATFYERDHALPAYRTGFVACKARRDMRLLEQLEHELPTWFARRTRDSAQYLEPTQFLSSSPAFQRCQQAISSLKTFLTNRDQHMRNLELRGQELQQQVAHRDNLLRDAEQQVAHRDNLLRVSQEQTAHLSKLLEEAKQEVAHRDNLLQDLHQQVAHRDNLLQELRQQVAHLTNLLELARQEAEHRGNLLAQASEQLRVREQEVAHRDNLLQELRQQVAHLTNLLDIARQEAEHRGNLLAQASEQLRVREQEILAHLRTIESLQTKLAELQIALQQAGYEREYLELELARAHRELNLLPVRLVRGLRRWFKPQEEERTT